MADKVLNDNFAVQTTFWACGPFATHDALTVRGLNPSWQEVASSLHTTTNGTDSSNDVVRTLNAYLGPIYGDVFIGGNDATLDQREALRVAVVASIDAGYALVANVVGPVAPSDGGAYNYPGGHYVTILGYANDGASVYVGDVAVRKYWVTIAQMATWIAGRGYSYAAHVPAVGPAPDPSNLDGRPWPAYMQPGNYFGLITGPAQSHGGYYAQEQPDVLAIQLRLQQLGYAPNRPGWADSKFEQPTADAVAEFQHAKLPGTTIFGQVWSDDWAALFAPVPVTPPPIQLPPPPDNPAPVGDVIYGVDLSDFDTDRGNSPAIVGQYRAAGISFVTHKIVEFGQTDVTAHVKAGPMLTAARDAGVPFLGGYLVVRSEHPADVQVDIYIKTLDQNVPWWRIFPGFFHQIDLEKWPYDAVAASQGNTADQLLAAATGQPVLMYASKGQYGDDVLAQPRWNANYPSNAAQEFKSLYASVGGNDGPGWVAYGTPSVLPLVWQYSSHGIVAGQGTTDVNAYRGTEAQFATALGFHPASVPVPPPVVVDPLDNIRAGLAYIKAHYGSVTVGAVIDRIESP